jgi:hypothetical protein
MVKMDLITLSFSPAYGRGFILLGSVDLPIDLGIVSFEHFGGPLVTLGVCVLVALLDTDDIVRVLTSLTFENTNTSLQTRVAGRHHGCGRP